MDISYGTDWSRGNLLWVESNTKIHCTYLYTCTFVGRILRFYWCLLAANIAIFVKNSQSGMLLNKY